MSSAKRKRVFDLMMAALLLIPSSVIVFLCAAIIAFECRGNPIFVQRRVGQHGLSFNLIKIRTMHINTVSVPSHQADVNQVLKVGKLIRRFKIDELPQIINVIKNEMSFVGPRPCLESQTEVISERAKLGVDVLKPGITGLSQICGIDMARPKMLARKDAEYLQSYGLRFDLKIIYRTLVGSGTGDAISS
ncbi:MAG: lipid carrier--UDP-N-acetylgalactosaminyltransferase [Cyanobacteria bacterium DS2.008]|uniref:sugar transferase n=1 Tax=Blastomonas sp. TaxID=1909299 RepID=UPI0017BC4BFB|nr:lipid carrier--UDP-N-acetylgalactosaminyltransferase [Cyanobacteria bacterium DS2.008]MBA4781350.1 sugar transferase [Blastomonas sp.]